VVVSDRIEEDRPTCMKEFDSNKLISMYILKEQPNCFPFGRNQYTL
jgi:hypothetical protein